MIRTSFSLAGRARCCMAQQEPYALLLSFAPRLLGTEVKGFSTADPAEATATTSEAPKPRPTLTAEQRQHLDALLYKLQRPAALARKIALLGATAGTYRDLYVAVDDLYRREIMGLPSPLLGPPTVSKPFHQPARKAGTTPAPDQAAQPAGAGAPADQQQQQQQQPPQAPPTPHRRAAQASRPPFPVVDVSLLPDGEEVGLELQERLMDTQAAWAQLQPSHIEMSHQLLTAVSLCPPSEATYPTHVNFAAAMRLLEHHKSRKRMRLLKRLLGKQDKYQIKAHGHYSGQA